MLHALINVILYAQTHHKEICLAVDTAKLILAAFPTTTRLVVSGIGPEFQHAMGEMLDAVSAATQQSNSKCLILFPAEDAMTFDAIEEDMLRKREEGMDVHQMDVGKGWDVIVIDGTWSQARKMHSKYFGESEGSLYRVKLSDAAVEALGGSSKDEIDASGNDIARGHQLRRHPIKVRLIVLYEYATMASTLITAY